jgi:hypothetical protein
LCISGSKIGLSSLLVTPPTLSLSLIYMTVGRTGRPEPGARRSNGEGGEELAGFVLSVDEELAE